VGVVKSFQRLTERFGIRIAPHDVRDAAATAWAILAPDWRLPSICLCTAIKHCNRARGIADVGPPHVPRCHWSGRLEKRIGGLAKGNDGHSGAQAGTTAP